MVDPSRVPDVPLTAPGDSGGLHNVFRQRYLLRLLVRKELKARYQGSVLGLLWSYVQPAVRFLAYFLVIGVVLGQQRGVENFAIHIFSAMVMVHYFTETFSSGTRSIVRNKNILQKMSLPREMFPVASMLVSAYHTFPQIVILLVGVVLTGWSPTPYDVAAGLLGVHDHRRLRHGARPRLQRRQRVLPRLPEHRADLLDLRDVVGADDLLLRTDREPRRRHGVGAGVPRQPHRQRRDALPALFWVPTVPEGSDLPPVMPDDLMTRGLVVLAVCLVLLALAQVVFTRLEAKFAERL